MPNYGSGLSRFCEKRALRIDEKCQNSYYSDHLMPAENLPKIYLYRRIVQAKLFIDRHYEEDIDAGDIADEACYSKFHFIRTFKSIYGKTPHQYLTAVRIEKAKEMLETEMSVTEVCFALGFDSLGSFISLFKRRTGMTPSAYRRGKLERKQQMLEKPLSFIPGCFVEQMNQLQK